MSGSQVVTDLRAAADVLERDGWCQLRAHATTGEHCAAGALEAAIDPNYRNADGWVDDQNIRFGNALSAMEHQAGILTTWNDTPGRTATEVITALRAAADATETRGSDGQR